MSDYNLRSFVSADIAPALKLWSEIPGLGVGLSDRPEELIAFLQRNPGLSRVATIEDQIVGTLLSGHDGRRGFLYHLAVDESFQRQGIGRTLVQSCVSQLERCGIPRTTIHIYANNESGTKFWQSIGWHFRTDLAVMQIPSSAY